MTPARTPEGTGAAEGRSGTSGDPPRPRGRAWLPNLGLLLLSTALALGAAEWFLRTYLPVGGFLYRLDPRYLYALAPNTRTLFVHGPQNGGGSVLVTVNSQGFRGDELRGGDLPRVVVYGDSCIEADYSRLAETFTKRLEARLEAASGRRVETVNAGVNGWGPDQALRRFQDEASSLKPRAIVFTVFADNDFGDLIRNRLYRLEGDRLVEAGGRLVPPVEQMFEATEAAPSLALWDRLRHLIRRSRRPHRLTPGQREQRQEVARARYLRSSLELCRQEFDAVVVKGDARIADLVKDHYDADVSLDPGSEAARYKRALLEAVLREVRATAERSGVGVLVLVVPSPIDVCDDCEIAVDPEEFPQYDRRRLTAEAAEAARRAGLPVLDLFDVFRRSGADGLYYRRPEDHWNAQGQDLAARLVSERILAEGWLGRANH